MSPNSSITSGQWTQKKLLIYSLRIYGEPFYLKACIYRYYSQGVTYEFLLIVYTQRTEKTIKIQTLSEMLRRVLFILVARSPDGLDETWFDVLSKRLLKHPSCGEFYRKYVNFSQETLEIVMQKGSSTFAKALSTETEFLRDLINYCKGLPTDEDVVIACEQNLKTVDLDIAADATYVSAIS